MLALVIGCWLLAAEPPRAHTPTPRVSSVNPLGLAETAKGGRELKEGLSFGLLTRRKEDKTMISVSLSLHPRAAAAVLTPGVECVALKELRALRARILPNRLLDALDLCERLSSSSRSNFLQYRILNTNY
jgi:hypothetical protein